MTREELQKTISEKRTAIGKIREDIDNIKDAYIKENCPYKVGDKVKVITSTKVEIGICSCITLTDDGVFRPCVNKIKKDGTMSCFELFGYHFSKIEKVED